MMLQLSISVSFLVNLDGLFKGLKSKIPNSFQKRLEKQNTKLKKNGNFHTKVKKS